MVAKQLAHNAFGGTDDAEVINRLLDEIATPDLKLEASSAPSRCRSRSCRWTPLRTTCA